MADLPPSLLLARSHRTASIWMMLPEAARVALHDQELDTVSLFASATEPSDQDACPLTRVPGIHEAFLPVLLLLCEAAQHVAESERRPVASVPLGAIAIEARLREREAGAARSRAQSEVHSIDLTQRMPADSFPARLNRSRHPEGDPSARA